MMHPFDLPQFVLAQSAASGALTTFLLYTAAVFVLAGISNRLLQKREFVSEYFLGSRSLGVWAFALTFAATSSSGGSFTGFPSLVYTHGWILALWIGSYMVVPICTMGLLGKRLNHVARISGAITVPDVIRDRFRSPQFGMLAVLLIVFFMSFNLVAQFKAGSEILNTLLQDVPSYKSFIGWVAQAKAGGALAAIDEGYLTSLLMFAVAVIIYTSYGGFHAVVWTDVMQGIVMFLGVIIMVPLAFSQVGGLAGATQEMAQMTPPRVGFVRLEVAAPPAESFSIVSPWLTLPGEDDERPRLFRVSRTLTIPHGQTIVNHVPVVEITTPSEIDRQLKRLQEPAEVTARNARLQQLIESQLRGLNGGDSQTEASLERARAQLQDNTLAVLNPPGLELFDVALTRIQDYAYGSGEPGVYVEGPGPEPSRLPPNPGILELTLTPAGTSFTIVPATQPEAPADAKGISTGRPQWFSLEGGAYRIFAGESAGATREVHITAGGSESVQLNADASAGDSPHTVGPPPEPSAIGFLPVSLAISFFFMWAISGAGQPSNMVRLMAFNSTETLKRAIFTVAIYYSLIYIPLVLIFCCSRVLLPGMELESDRIMPQMAVTLTSNAGYGWLAGLLIAAPFAAVMSTVDSFLLMISSALVRDVYQRNVNPNAPEKTLRRLSYLTTLSVGVAAVWLASDPPYYLQNIIVYTGSGLAACFLAPMVYALYWPRANAAGCIAAMLAGFAAHLSMYVTGSIVNGSFYDPYQLAGVDPIIVGLFVSFVAGYLVTRATAPPPDDLVQKYFYRKNA